MYNDLNNKAKNYLIKILKQEFYKQFDSADLYNRCLKEIDLLYDKKYLFLIQYLYEFKKLNKSISYEFQGMLNNFLFLYVIGLNFVNPLEFDLPYELYNEKEIHVNLIGAKGYDLVSYLNKQDDDFKIISGFFIKEEIPEINNLLTNHYLILPCNHLNKLMLFHFNQNNMLETINDFREYQDKYVTIKIGTKEKINNYEKISIENVITNSFEKNLVQILNPQTLNDFIKIKSLAHGASLWLHNEDFLVSQGKLNLNNLISSREDVYTYLLNHSLSKEKALEITNFISNGQALKKPIKWAKYEELMQDNHCEDLYIDIFTSIEYLFGKGGAVNECLFALNKDNYANLK